PHLMQRLVVLRVVDRHLPDEAERIATEIEALAAAAEELDFDGVDLDVHQARNVRHRASRIRRSLIKLTRAAQAMENTSWGRPGTICIECGRRFHPLRSDARYCSSTCRSRTRRRNS